MIKIENTLKTSVTYNGNGTQTHFDFPFDYLRKSFVHVSVNNALMNNISDYTIDGRTVVFNTAPTSGSVIRIYRETSTDRLVVWADASVLKAADMTIQQVQQLHILEETNDWTKSSSIVLNDEGTAWQGRNYRLTNISDPIDEQDAVTKRYIDNEENSFMVAMNALKNQTEQMANQASTNANNAKKSEANAKLSETNAKTSADSARDSADSAGNSANEAQTYMNNAKNYSENVNVFIPSVSAAGVLSWTNRAGLDNPASVNIKGEKGDKGEQGTGITIKGKYDSLSALIAAHPKGNEGDAYMVGVNLYVWSGTEWIDCGNIKGDKGDKGDKGATGAPGAAATIRIGNVVTGAPGTNVSVSNSGTSANAILNFMIPRGTPADAATIRIGNVYTGAPGTDADVINSGNSTNAILNFKIPRGAPGADGGVTVDEVLNATSFNPIANKAVYAALQEKVTAEEIANTYAKKTDVSGMVKSVNNVKPDSNGNVSITVSGGGSSVTVDTALSATSTNPVQNRVIKEALDGKLGKTEIAAAALKDGAGNNIVDTYAKKIDIRGMVKSVNDVSPDDSGNVSLGIFNSSGHLVLPDGSEFWIA